MFERLSVLFLLAISSFIYYVISYRISQSHIYFWIPEASILMIIGLISSFILIAVDTIYQPVTFDTDLFFLFLLPPMIFASGLDIDIRIFYNNLASIMFFANIGTIVGALVFGLLFYMISIFELSNKLTSLSECLVFGAILSATDPVSTISMFQKLKVDRKLYNVVLAVSIIDDGVTIMMFNLFSNYVNNSSPDPSDIIKTIFYFSGVIIGSMFLGYLIGALFVYLLKNCLKNITNDKVRLCSLLFCIVYISNSIATIIKFSGILTTMFTAISFKRYFQITFGNIKVIGVYDLFLFISQFFENFIFLQIGLTLFSDISPNSPNVNKEGPGVWAFIGWSVLFSMISRIAQVYPLSFLFNICYKKSKNSSSNAITRKESTVVVEEEDDEDDDDDYEKPQQQLITAVEPNSTKITDFKMNYQHMMFLAGVRGPISYASSHAYAFHNQSYIQSATDVVIIVTVVVFGFITYPMLFYLGIEMNCEEIINEEVDLDSETASQYDNNQNSKIYKYWSFLGNQVLKADAIIIKTIFTSSRNEHEDFDVISERIETNVVQ